MKAIIAFIVLALVGGGVYLWQGKNNLPVATAVPEMSDAVQATNQPEAKETLDCSKIISPAELNAVFGQNGTARITTRGEYCDWEIKNPSGPRYSSTDVISGHFTVIESRPEDIEFNKKLSIKLCTEADSVNTVYKTPMPTMLNIGEYSCFTISPSPSVHVDWDNKTLVLHMDNTTLSFFTMEDISNEAYKKEMIDFAKLIFPRVK